MERKPRVKRSNLFKNATPEQLKEINEISKQNRGISKLTFQDIFGHMTDEEFKEWYEANQEK